MNFNHDYWINLHMEDPEKFEIERKKQIELLLDTFNPKNRLKYTALQSRIDLYRKRNSYYNSFVYINKLMIESLNELDAAFNERKN